MPGSSSKISPEVGITDALRNALKNYIQTGNDKDGVVGIVLQGKNELSKKLVNTKLSTGKIGASKNNPLDYILDKVMKGKVNGTADDNIQFNPELVDSLIENGAELSEEGKDKLLGHMAKKDNIHYDLGETEAQLFKRLVAMPSMADHIKGDKDLVMKTMYNGHAEAVPGLIAAGANQEMNLGDKKLEEEGLRKQIFDKATSSYKGKALQDGDQELQVDNVIKIDNWNALADISAQAVIDRNAGKDSKVNYIDLAKDLVANGAKIGKVKMVVSTEGNGENKIIHKNMLDILKDNIKSQKTPENKAAAKQDFDLMKDALREGQAALKVKIIEDRAKRGGYKALLSDAAHMLKKVVGIQVEETERDRLRNKQKDIGKALRASGSLSSSVVNVVTGNVNLKKNNKGKGR
jgi:hypothetical protein